MQKYIHYNKWTGSIIGHSFDKSNYCISMSIVKINEILKLGLYDHIVHNNQVIKKDNIVRFNKEKKLTEIKYDKHGTVKLNIYPDDNLIKLHVNSPFRFIDKQQIDRIKFEDPILKIFVHSKKSPELLGTLEIDLNEYFKTGKYEQDISTILSKVNVTDLIFKTHRCFEHYAYEILESDIIKIKKIDRNLIDEDCHIIVDYWPNRELFINETYRVKNGIIIKNNVRYWQEFEHMLNDKIMIGFIDKHNPAKLEHYISFTLKQLQEQESLSFDKPYNIILTNKNIYCNKKQLKIKYEDTSN